MKIDFYVATVKDVPAFQLVDELQALFGGAVQVNDSRKKRQYQHAVTFDDLTTERTEGIVRWGGNGGGVNVDFSGASSAVVADFLRSKYPSNHSPSRLDICEDRRGENLFDQMHAYGVELARASNPRIKVEHHGDWTFGEGGRSLYFGSTQSAWQVVLYEKGHLLRKEGIEAPLDLVRLELRLRPDGDFRQLIGRCEIPSLWGVSGFAQSMLERLSGLSAARFTIPAHPVGDDERFRHFVAQWGAHVLRWGSADPSGFMDRIAGQLGVVGMPRKRAA